MCKRLFDFTDAFARFEDLEFAIAQYESGLDGQFSTFAQRAGRPTEYGEIFSTGEHPRSGQFVRVKMFESHPYFCLSELQVYRGEFSM